MFNKLLKRQIRKIFKDLDSVPAGTEQLLKAVSDAYDAFDVDRKLIERSFNLSSEEFISINKKLSMEIVERKMMEEEFQKSESKLKAIFNNSGGAIFIADTKSGKLIDCNLYAEKITGYSREEIIGMHQSKLHPAEENEKYSSKFKQHIRLEHVSDYEGSIKCKDGRLIPVLISAEVMETSGEIVIVGLFIDISQQKKMEEELKERLRDLERFKEVAVDREIRMIDLKKEINSLAKELGKEEPYDLRFVE